MRERARIDEIVSSHVTLKPAGVGSLKGLCPFHDERSPSFHVRPQVGRWHCFGCNEGGDVISFVQKIDGMTFTEAVEYLADRVGIQLRYEEGGGPRRTEEPGKRQRLLEAHRVASQFFSEQLFAPGATVARTFLAERSFDRSDAERFGVGFAPTGWDALLRHLRGRGFTEAELIASGLMSQGQRGIYDRFRGRLVWPIRDVTGETIGFGARKLFDEDQGPKYLNTPETTLYKKSQVLYGIDLAKREIAKNKRVVVVEGYTDVMAAHLSGITTAVATCGTAFGSDHARIVRRLLGDTTAGGGLQLASGASLGGEIVFTFDGDAAGQKAAVRAFGEDQRFYAQTFVAVEPSGMDPCELRMAHGPEGVRALVEGRQPLFEFVIRTTLDTFDLDTAEGRVAALRAAAPVVAGIRDTALRPEYARMLAGWIGMDSESVRRAVAAAGKAGVPQTLPAPVRPLPPHARRRSSRRAVGPGLLSAGPARSCGPSRAAGARRRAPVPPVRARRGVRRVLRVGLRDARVASRARRDPGRGRHGRSGSSPGRAVGRGRDRAVPGDGARHRQPAGRRPAARGPRERHPGVRQGCHQGVRRPGPHTARRGRQEPPPAPGPCGGPGGLRGSVRRAPGRRAGTSRAARGRLRTWRAPGRRGRRATSPRVTRAALCPSAVRSTRTRCCGQRPRAASSG
ncbi:DNA primase [Oerskovia enterophila]|uniref:DNA primase n=1 Tax=Oerskovia enterophila TaxID=43678 RepID=A0A163R8J2_9CELL|nr:DNA primase [Oerskovia enterophila]